LIRLRAAALANQPPAQEAADAHLAGGGGALGAALSGFFAACGAHPSVLLGPLTILVGGTGQGARAFDGRPRQPGLTAKRPRGFAEGTQVPLAARVAAPSSPFAAVIAHAYAGQGGFSQLVRPGIETAERAGAAERARLLERLARVGASALTEPGFRRPLLGVASASEGGNLTAADLEPPPDTDVAAREGNDGTEACYELPWSDAASVGAGAAGFDAGVCAVDTQGVFAAVGYRVADSGLTIAELELVAPLLAVPVLRGVPRIAPGARLGKPNFIRLLLDAERRFHGVRAAADGARNLTLYRDPISRWVTAQQK